MPPRARGFLPYHLDGFTALFADSSRRRNAEQGAVRFFGGRLRGMPDRKVTIEASVANGDTAAASFVYEGTQTGEYLGAAPPGRKLRFTSCDIFRIADGKIVEHWGMGDIAGIIAQLKG